MMNAALPDLNTLVSNFAGLPLQESRCDNLIRAANAAQLLLPVMKSSGVDEIESGIVQLMVDLLHLQHYLYIKNESGHSVDIAVQQAFMHFDVDTEQP
ncbi:hypothetical protein [Serratia ficaria]|uniref:hypothetical protein n=1 Tax=Serratia ficaria TaxID=61651 RepID=UPI002183D4CD|nr:hypothetical protein [Serratia ficaria]CAI2537554.1 Uncharacterised protein [Serratia ficaria]